MSEQGYVSFGDRFFSRHVSSLIMACTAVAPEEGPAPALENLGVWEEDSLPGGVVLQQTAQTPGAAWCWRFEPP